MEFKLNLMKVVLLLLGCTLLIFTGFADEKGRSIEERQMIEEDELHFRTWNIARKTENHGKWEIHTLGREIWRGKLKNLVNFEISTVGRGYGKKLKITENEKYTL